MNETSDAQPALTPVDFDPFGDGELTLTAPATAAQSELWVSSQMGDDASCAYNESVTLTCVGPFDEGAMRASLIEVVRRHEALRTTLSRDGKLLCVAAPGELPVPTVDLSPMAPVDREARLAGILRSEVEAPFDLEHGPLFKAQIVRMAEEDHRVIMTAHHVVCDGWSFAVIFQDLGVLYSARRKGEPPALKEVHKFSEYAKLERAEEAQPSAIEGYWLKQFEGELPVLDLPTDRPRPPIRSYAADRIDHRVGGDLVKALKKVGGRAGASFFVTLLAAFSAHVYRLSGQRDLCIGIPAAGQSAVDKEMLVGHCANLLPLRIRLDPSKPFSEHLKVVRRVVLDAYDNQRYTFGRLLSKLTLPRDPSRLPLVPLLFNLDVGVEGAGLKFEGLDVSYCSNARSFENFEVFVNAVEGGGDVVLETQFSTALFERETIKSRLEGLTAMLAGVAADVECPIERLPVLSDAEQKRVVVEWNATRADVPAAGSVHRLFEQQAARTPEKTAVKSGRESMSYADLDRWANRIAHGLAQAGAGPGTLVGLCLERSIGMVAGLLGVLKTGAAYVPMDHEFPRARLAHMLDDSRAALVLTQAELEDALPPTSARVLMLEGDEIARASSDPLRVEVGPSDRAYVIYTSGSTGTPKGVEVPHGAVVNFLSSMKKRPGIGADDVLVAVTTLSFDIAGLEIFLPIVSGATTVVASREVAADGYLLAQALSDASATMMQATPATWRLLIGAGWMGGLKVLCGGEALPPDLARALVERAGRVHNLYGPTETTIWSTCHEITEKEAPVLIGKPIDNTTVYVLDGAMQPVPVGVPGELWIGGGGVALGYLGREELTRERFVPDPFSTEPGARLYRTGDVVRWLPSGELEYQRRNDTQVKVRGYRIELGEIEAVLAEHRAVGEAVALVVEERPGDVRVVGYVVLRPGEEVTVTDLRKHLRRKLPEYMIPNVIEELTEMPRTPNGKVDRVALRQRGIARRAPEAPTPPRTDTEKLVAEVFQKALKIDRVGVHDNFYELGGDSLLSMEVVVDIQQQTQVRIALRTVLLESLEQIARAVETARHAS